MYKHDDNNLVFAPQDVPMFLQTDAQHVTRHLVCTRLDQLHDFRVDNLLYDSLHTLVQHPSPTNMFVSGHFYN